MTDQALTEEFYDAMQRLEWSHTEPNPYSDMGRFVNIFHEFDSDLNRRWTSKIIHGTHDAVLEHCKFEVVRSLQATLPMYEHMAYQVVEATELHESLLRIKLRKSYYAGD